MCELPNDAPIVRLMISNFFSVYVEFGQTSSWLQNGSHCERIRYHPDREQIVKTRAAVTRGQRGDALGLSAVNSIHERNGGDFRVKKSNILQEIFFLSFQQYYLSPPKPFM